MCKKYLPKVPDLERNTKQLTAFERSWTPHGRIRMQNITHVLCKPIHCFFPLFISTTVNCLQTIQ